MHEVRVGFVPVPGGGGSYVRSKTCPNTCCMRPSGLNLAFARDRCSRFRGAWREMQDDGKTEARWAYFVNCADSVEEAVALDLMED